MTAGSLLHVHYEVVRTYIIGYIYIYIYIYIYMEGSWAAPEIAYSVDGMSLLEGVTDLPEYHTSQFATACHRFKPPVFP